MHPYWIYLQLISVQKLKRENPSATWCLTKYLNIWKEAQCINELFIKDKKRNSMHAIRWKQRFQNYEQAFLYLQESLAKKEL